MGRPRQMYFLNRTVVSLVTAALVFVLWPAAASAAAPVAMDESVAVVDPTTVPLEATAAEPTEMTFAIPSNPAHGSLGQISSSNCQYSGGVTDCKATVVYTPYPCSTGPDSFTYTATDTGAMATSSPALVSLSPAPPATGPPAPALPPTGVATAGVTFTGTVQNALSGATVDYGDNSGVQTLAVDSSGDAPLSHVYSGSGSYTLTVTNHGVCGTSSVATEEIEVLSPGVLNVATASAVPGGSARISVSGLASLTAILTVSTMDQVPSAVIIGATYASTNPLFRFAGPPGAVAGAFDVRAINVSANDSIVVTFSYADGGVPTAASLRFFDATRGTFVSVRPSTLAPHSLVVDVAHHLITIVLDKSSLPTITGLTGTRFAVIAQPPAISGLAVTPRCVGRASVGSLRLRLTVSERATLQIRVRRRPGLRVPNRCTGHQAPATPAGHRVVRLHFHLRPGFYTVTVRAQNIHGHSRARSTTFAVAAG